MKTDLTGRGFLSYLRVEKGVAFLTRCVQSPVGFLLQMSEQCGLGSEIGLPLHMECKTPDDVRETG